MIDTLDKWHKTKAGLLIFAAVELIVAYAFISLAINSGSPWYYLLVLIFFVGGLQNFIKLIGSFFHAKARRF